MRLTNRNRFALTLEDFIVLVSAGETIVKRLRPNEGKLLRRAVRRGNSLIKRGRWA